MPAVGDTFREITRPFPCPGCTGGTVRFTVCDADPDGEPGVVHVPVEACAWFLNPRVDVLDVAIAVRRGLGLPDPPTEQ